MSAEIHTRAESSSPLILPRCTSVTLYLASEKFCREIETLSPCTPATCLESFRNFENRMYSEYQQMQKEFGFRVIEGKKSKSKK